MHADSNTAADPVADVLSAARALEFRLEDEGRHPSLDWEARLELAALAREIVAGLTQLQRDGD